MMFPIITFVLVLIVSFGLVWLILRGIEELDKLNVWDFDD